MNQLETKAEATGFWICDEEAVNFVGKAGSEKVRFIMGPRKGLQFWVEPNGKINGPGIKGYTLKNNQILHNGNPTGYFVDKDLLGGICGPEEKLPWEQIDLKAWNEFYKNLF